MAKRTPGRSERVPAKGKRKPAPEGKPVARGRAWLLVASDSAEPMEKRKIGRPRVIASPEEFLARMDAYLAVCAEIEEPLTMTGMALALGFTSRQSLFDYGKDPAYSYPVKLARSIVEHDYEMSLRLFARAGDIFGCKNFGWTDEHTMRVTGEGGGPVKFADMTDAQIRERGTQLSNRLAALEAAHAGAVPLPPGGGNGSKPPRKNGSGA